MQDLTGRSETRPLAGLRVLVVDDSAPMRRALGDLLTAAGAAATICAGPDEALETLRRDPAAFDALLTDYDMPCATGADLARAARSTAPDLPILLCTAEADWTARETGEDALFDHVLEKPVAGATLRAALRAVTFG